MPNREQPERELHLGLGDNLNSLADSVAHFRAMPCRSTVAGSLTQLMLKNNPALEFGTVLNNLGNDEFTVFERLAMYNLYTAIKARYTGALPQLADLDERLRTMALNEIIRALFKGEIPLEGLDAGGFELEIRCFATRIRMPA